MFCLQAETLSHVQAEILSHVLDVSLWRVHLIGTCIYLISALATAGKHAFRLVDCLTIMASVLTNKFNAFLILPTITHMGIIKLG